ncbi:hypothetical protein Tco_1123869 [Tanacetum coccineum]|uniref:Uncharacterized protein n=1 Tax=Tanacetum coccineum TaxID=301880 RepID=A0ABQ5J8D7_9ASTR
MAGWRPMEIGGNRNGRNENPDELLECSISSQLPREVQVKYAYLLDSALTWWNSHKRTIGTEAALPWSWRESAQ